MGASVLRRPYGLGLATPNVRVCCRDKRTWISSKIGENVLLVEGVRSGGFCGFASGVVNKELGPMMVRYPSKDYEMNQR